MGTKLAKDPYDGTLAAWTDVEKAEEWDALVLGNGMSINLWANFNYDSLYIEAQTSRLLSRKDQELFDALGLTNFEEVLRRLSDAIVLGEAIGENRPAEQARHDSIQKALAKAVQRVHITGGEVPEENLAAIGNELRNYGHVFTTSYDLLVYWATAKAENGFDDFYDLFWCKSPPNSFDEASIKFTQTSRTVVYFLHGALHLVVLGDGTTCKNRSTMFTLLEKFGKAFHGDRTASPLIVTEAAASDKLKKIKGSDYLSYCWKVLAERDCPIVVFGHSLSGQDAHLIDALNEHPGRPVAVALRKSTRAATRKEQHRIAGSLAARHVYFFDASTHPLGAKELTIRETPWRKLHSAKTVRPATAVVVQPTKRARIGRRSPGSS
jgi:hypothetical protein